MNQVNKAASAGTMAAQLRKAAKKGRGGDTMLAHINEDEARMLRMMGGAGTRNPHTGLLEFRGGPGSAKAGEHTYGGERPGGKGSAGGTSGGNPTYSNKPKPAGVNSSQQVDRLVMEKYVADPNEHIPNERAYWDAVSNLGPRSRDYRNKGNSALDSLGNALAGMVGVGEIDPTQQALGAGINNPRASWGVDPISVGASIAGAALGAPLGSLYGIGKKLTGYQGPMVGFDGYSDQSPFSNRVVSPVVNGNQSLQPGGGNTANVGRPTGSTRTGVGGTIAGPLKAPTPSIFAPQAPAAQPAPPAIFPPKPPVQTPFQVAGGKPYGFSLFSRAA